MTTDSSPPTNRPFAFIRHFSVPVAVFTAGVLVSELANGFLASSHGSWWATVLAWRLGPWSRFPIPFDKSVFDNTGFNIGQSVSDWLPLAVVLLLLMGLILSGLHGCLFLCTVAIYRRFGRPPYLPDVCERLSRVRIWKTSVLRSWWILPLVGLVYGTWQWFAIGQAYAQYQVFSIGWPFTLAMTIIAVVAYLQIAGRALCTAVRTAILPDERRCGQCAYLLRGLSGKVCPECGTPFDTLGCPKYSLFSQRLGKRIPVARIAWIATIVLVVTAPAWEPALISVLSWRVLVRLPSALQATGFAFGPTNNYPLKLGAFAVLRQGREVAVLRVPMQKPPPSIVRWWYWKEMDAWGRREPDQSGSVKVPQVLPGTISIGTCPVTVIWTGWQDQWWAWLSLGNPAWRLDVLEPVSAPDQLRKLAAQIDKKK